MPYNIRLDNFGRRLLFQRPDHLACMLTSQTLFALQLWNRHGAAQRLPLLVVFAVFDVDVLAVADCSVFLDFKYRQITLRQNTTFLDLGVEAMVLV